MLALVAVLVLLVTGSGGTTATPRTPTEAVSAFDTSFRTADCALFQEVTTSGFQQSFFSGAFDCAKWEANAGALQVDGQYAYSVEVGEETIAEDEKTAAVLTTETDSSGETPRTYLLTYRLVPKGAGWVIDGLDSTG